MSAFNPQNGVVAVGAWASGQNGQVKGGVMIRTGVGLYQMTLDQSVNQNDGGALVCCANGAIGTLVHTSDAIKTFNTFTQAGAAADAGGRFMVYRITP